MRDSKIQDKHLACFLVTTLTIIVTFKNQLFPVVLPTSSFWWELVVVQLDRTTWKRGDAQNGCAVRKIADLVLELVFVVDANILY